MVTEYKQSLDKIFIGSFYQFNNKMILREFCAKLSATT